MSSSDDRRFAGDIPQIYERLLVPLIFAPYARDLAERSCRLRPRRVLELAAGTGVVTRELAEWLPAGSEIVATDLNAGMLEQAQQLGTRRDVLWRQADAMQLPFAADAFDLVVCQFGAMFFPARAGAFAEVHRVLETGGSFLFNVWDTLDSNAFAACLTAALAVEFAADPPRFLARTPHGYHDAAAIRADLAAAGFASPPRIETLTFESRAASAHDVAAAYCLGTPLRNEIERRAPGGLDAVTARVTAALAQRFGQGHMAGPIQAKVVSVEC